MTLPQSDVDYLQQRGLPFSVTEEAGVTCIVFPGFPLPPGLDRSTADLLVRLNAGFPDVPPDMWWFDPGVHYANGGVIQATESVESYLGRTWQRWSRHLSAGQWQPGTDTMQTFLALIDRELGRHAMETVQ
jgi:Prokaryotic E2 family E